jgi:hypothetical protein
VSLLENLTRFQLAVISICHHISSNDDLIAHRLFCGIIISNSHSQLNLVQASLKLSEPAMYALPHFVLIFIPCSTGIKDFGAIQNHTCVIQSVIIDDDIILCTQALITENKAYSQLPGTELTNIQNIVVGLNRAFQCARLLFETITVFLKRYYTIH